MPRQPRQLSDENQLLLGLRRQAANFPIPEAHLVSLGAAIVLHLLHMRLRARRGTAIAGLLQATHRSAPRWGPAVLRPVGVAVTMAGAVLILWSWRTARILDIGRPDKLLETGPYLYCRNPMYVGWTLLHAGYGLAAANRLTAFLLPAAVALTHTAVILEEEALADAFGDEYLSYRARVPRYLARLPARGPLRKNTHS